MRNLHALFGLELPRQRNQSSAVPDNFSKDVRSRIMSAIRKRGNKSTELRLAAVFRQNKISGWRRHMRILGNPDFIFPKLKVAVFADGCFWYGCRRHYR